MKLGRIMLILMAVAAGCQARDVLSWSRPPIRVGILHSQTGAMAEIEQSMIDAEIMALEEINASGGLLGGRRVEWTIADGQSDAAVFAREARRLLLEVKVQAIFGCYTSFSRKAVLPEVEDAGGLLFYPAYYEGLEQSPNVAYIGAAPNQQIIPTLKWAHDHLGARSFYLIGVDSLYSHGLNEIIKDVVYSLDARIVGEHYVSFNSQDFRDPIAAIKEARPDMVINSLTGASNSRFCHELRAAGATSAGYPMISYTLDEELVQRLPSSDVAGDYLTASYLQVINTPENHAFIERFKARFGRDRVTSDLVDTAYNGVRFWAQAVQEAETDTPRAVRAMLGRQSLNAPEGIISIDATTQHAWRPLYIGKVRPDRTIEILWSSETPIRPEPFPSGRTHADWNRFVDHLRDQWGGNWVNQATSGQPTTPPERSPRRSQATKSQ